MNGSFVILEHSTDQQQVHFDFMLEADGVLATWQLEINPITLQLGQRQAAVQLADHRLTYLTYEGPISGGRGQVRRVQQGSYENVDKGVDSWRFRLAGETMTGEFLLTRQGSTNQWLLILVPEQVE